MSSKEAAMRMTVMKLTLLSATVATSMVLAAGSGAYAISGYGGGHGYPTHPPLHGPGSSHNPIVKRAPVHGPGSSHNPIVKRSLHGPGSSHNPIVVRRRGRY
jgi:hypothetical protein